MAPIPVSRRSALLGGGALVATGGAMGVTSLRRSRRAEVPLYGETVAFAAPGEREIVPVGRVEEVVPDSRVLAARPFSGMLLEEEAQWLESSARWVRRSEDPHGLLRSGLLDLRALSAGLPVSVAGWTDRWRYAWPRDVSFVAAALARTGHPDQAASQLAYLKAVQRPDGWFEARYDIATHASPDDRAAQLDGCGWVLWGGSELARAAPDRAVELLAPLRPMFVLASRRLLASIDATTSLPIPSSDYWELAENRLTLGTAAAVLAGLRCATEILPLVGEMALTDRTRAASDTLGAQVRTHFGPAGYPRLLGGSAADAAVTFLVAPIGGTEPDLEVLSAVDRAQTAMSRPAGGVAPGESWKDDGISWTPETALFASAWAANGHRSKAESLLTWLGEHRTAAGSFPEKVLHDGRPAAVAPLAWTASLVVIALHELTLQ